MILSRDYRRPFWRGFFHALGVVFYCIFVALVMFSLQRMYLQEIAPFVRFVFMLFLFVLSVAVCGYLIFFYPIVKSLHGHFRASVVMLGSTLGWLFIFLVIFLLGLISSLGY